MVTIDLARHGGRARLCRAPGEADMSSTAYEVYLDSPVWKKLAKAARWAAGYKCDQCGFTSGLHVHHQRYPKVWGEETLEDLIVLCGYCHSKGHGKLPVYY